MRWRHPVLAAGAAAALAVSVGAEEGEAAPRRAPFGIPRASNDHPIAIEADALEATQSEGRRKIVFTKNVRVSQGDMEIRSSRLEAIYPAGADQPTEMVATGDVRFRQRGAEARCDRAVYHRDRELLVCSGAAELRDGDNRVRGSVIEVELATEVVRVTGGASVLIQPRAASPPVGTGSATP